MQQADSVNYPTQANEVNEERETIILKRLFNSQLELFKELIEHRIGRSAPEI